MEGEALAQFLIAIEQLYLAVHGHPLVGSYVPRDEWDDLLARVQANRRRIITLEFKLVEAGIAL